MRLALLGDIHAGHPWVPPWRLCGKRLLGWGNMVFNPRRKFDLARLAAAMETAAQHNIDGWLFSGDLSTTSLEMEFAKALRIILPRLQGKPAFFVPGNHDRYTRASIRLRTFESALGPLGRDAFPFWMRLTRAWYLLGIDSTRATPALFESTGEIGPIQLQHIREKLQILEEGDSLLVLCHYPLLLPPFTSHKPGHRLRDGGELLGLLQSCRGKVVFVHGHVHQPWIWRNDVAALEHITCINAGSPTHLSPQFPQGQGFGILELPENKAGATRLERFLPSRGETGPASAGKSGGNMAITPGEWQVTCESL